MAGAKVRKKFASPGNPHTGWKLPLSLYNIRRGNALFWNKRDWFSPLICAFCLLTTQGGKHVGEEVEVGGRPVTHRIAPYWPPYKLPLQGTWNEARARALNSYPFLVSYNVIELPPIM